MSLLALLFHLDTFLTSFISQYGFWIYFLIFIVLFCETGIFCPFPGDSIIFACSALAVMGLLNIWLLIFVCFTGAFLGAMLSYDIGQRVGKILYSRAKGRFFNKNNIDRAKDLLDKHGGPAIILSRFIPVARQFTPFVVGISEMPYRQFMLFNMIGVTAWVGIVTTLGFSFGNIPVVKNNFSAVIILIILISLLPAAFGYIKARMKQLPDVPK